MSTLDNADMPHDFDYVDGEGNKYTLMWSGVDVMDEDGDVETTAVIALRVEDAKFVVINTDFWNTNFFAEEEEFHTDDLFDIDY